MAAKKETEKFDEERRREIRTELSQQQHAMERGIDETRDKIKKTVDEARREIPRNTQAITDFQEQTLQTTKEIADNFLESQKEIIQSFQDAWLPYVDMFWNNGFSPRRAAELYAKTVGNVADNIITTTRLSNNAMFASFDAYKTVIQRERDDLKELSRLAINNARTFEHTSREVARG